MKTITRHGRSRPRIVALTAAGALVMALMPAGAVTAQEPEARGTDNVCDGDYEADFDDIAGSAHEGNVLCMADYGLTRGTGDGTSYSPRRDVTRGQMASFIARFIEYYTGDELEESDEGFGDVPDDYEHAENIHKLLEADITEGTSRSDGEDFEPQQPVTRGQMASFIARGLSYIDNGTARPEHQPPDTDADYFEDDDGSVHERNINALAGGGVVEGFGDGTYRPGNAVKRDQMASFVMRAFDWLVETETEPTEIFDVSLSWQNELVVEDGAPVYGQGQPGAEGNAELWIFEDENCVAFEIDYEEVDGPFDTAPGVHIHAGEIDENGPIVIFLATGADLEAADGWIDGMVCDEGADGEPFDVSEVLDDPDGYYVNVHSDDYPAGAIRGQLPDGGQGMIDVDD